MRKLVIILIILITNILNSQIHAITESGDEVLLNSNGTWTYINDSIVNQKEIELNETVFTKGEKASFLVKSKKLNIGIWINPKKWHFSKAAKNEDSEYKFSKKGDNLYALLITEKFQMPIETLRELIIQNAKNVAPDLKITKEEFKMVNGIKVLMVHMDRTIQGIRFNYLGYYYTNTQGSMQLLTFTAESLFDEYKDDIELFLNGLVEY